MVSSGDRHDEDTKQEQQIVDKPSPAQGDDAHA
jgi:hypothetical protein